jgi:hypothetical protein
MPSGSYSPPASPPATSARTTRSKNHPGQESHHKSAQDTPAPLDKNSLTLVRIKELDFPERPMAFFSLMDECTAWAVEIGC